MAKVFISHSSTDTWVALQVEGHIKACGLDTFLDERDIAAGDQFLQRIIDAERECDELLALLTPWSIKRAWVIFEISCFIHSGKRVAAVHHGLTPAKLMASPQVGDLLNRHDILDINKLDSYFSESRRRFAPASGGADA